MEGSGIGSSFRKLQYSSFLFIPTIGLVLFTSLLFPSFPLSAAYPSLFLLFLILPSSSRIRGKEVGDTTTGMGMVMLGVGGTGIMRLMGKMGRDSYVLCG